jgi:geranylgeranyl pyrophosphate synthase
MKTLDVLTQDIEQINERLAKLADMPGLKDFVCAPAKRIRPALALLYIRAKGESVDERIYSFLTAIELIHNASLIHDDILDESTARRGKPALHTTLGSKLAVISGDYLLSQAMTEVSKLNSIELVALLAETMRKMCLGELSQQNNRFKTLSVDEYILKSGQKTASLFEAAVAGCLVIANDGNCPPCKGGRAEHKCSAKGGFTTVTTLQSPLTPLARGASNFAQNFGIAFQIKNDLDSREDVENGVYNRANTELLEIYVDRALDSLKCLEENEYKSALTELTERLKNG